MLRDNLRIFGFTKTKIFLLTAVSIAAAFLEGFGMAMFLPLLQYIEKDRNIEVLLADSRMWQYLIRFFDLFSIKIGLLSLLVTVLLIMMLRVLFMYFRQVYTTWLSQDILHIIRTNLLKAYLESSHEFYASLSSGKVVNVLTTETQRVGGGCSAVFTLAANGIVILGYTAVLFWLSAAMTVVVLVFLVLAGLLVSYYVRHTRKLSHKTTDSNTRFSFQLLELLSAFRLIKVTAATGRELQRVVHASERVRDHNYWLSKLNARIDLLLEPIVIFCGLGIFYLAVSVFAMSLAQVGLFLLILLRMLPLCKEFLRSRQSFLSFSGSFNIVLSGYRDAVRNRETDSGTREFTGQLSDGIRFDYVSYTYPGQDHPALHDLSLMFPAGRMTALVGASGAGKTTLVDLLPRLRIPRTGTIRYDNKPAESFILASLRKAIAFVSQDVTILNDTVRANVAYADPKATEARVLDALEKSRAIDFVRQLPEGLDTVLGERGTRLSGGQKQRLSLARALLQNAPILILDEPTSALDSEVEKDIQDTIEEMRRSSPVTIIVIAHRLSTIREADRIVVIRDGTVAEQGTHEELIVSREWYAKICDLQNKRAENVTITDVLPAG